ncbi:MAG: pyridoxamine 5'-phosphate oxidase family protein [Butyrivibrio sp.]
MFEDKYFEFWKEFGTCKKMVLSTSLNDKVTSRMMSIVVMDGKLYFQTDMKFRKYIQLKGNPNVALCIDNIQIEGRCREIGKPADSKDFCRSFKECFPGSFDRYSMLENERLFVVTPERVERWVYIDNIPYMEIFDTKAKNYDLMQYKGA